MLATNAGKALCRYVGKRQSGHQCDGDLTRHECLANQPSGQSVARGTFLGFITEFDVAGNEPVCNPVEALKPSRRCWISPFRVVLFGNRIEHIDCRPRQVLESQGNFAQRCHLSSSACRSNRWGLNTLMRVKALVDFYESLQQRCKETLHRHESLSVLEIQKCESCPRHRCHSKNSGPVGVSGDDLLPASSRRTNDSQWCVH